jgi:hypothetical protein
MPIYTFRKKTSKKEFTEMMSISEMEDYMKKNPNIIQVPQVLNIVSGTGGMKNDSGWKDNLSRIAEAHPESALADRYGKKSIKEIKTKQALVKNKQRIASRGKK